MWWTCLHIYRRSFRCRKVTWQHTSRRRQPHTVSLILITPTSSWSTTMRRAVKSTSDQSSSHERSIQVVVVGLLMQTCCIFTAQPCTCNCPVPIFLSVSLSVCLIQASIVTKRPNLGSHIQGGRIAQWVHFSDASIVFMKFQWCHHPNRVTECRWGRLKSVIFNQHFTISHKQCKIGT